MQNLSEESWSVLLGVMEKKSNGLLISPWEKFIAYR